MSRRGGRRAGLALTGIAALVSGCASFSIEDSVSWTNEELAGYTGGELELARTDEQRRARAEVAGEILAGTVDREAAVRLALANSPAMQAMIADSWAEGADAAQSGRIPNPVFAFERIATDDEAEVEIERLFAFGLLDVLTLPLRKRVADRRIERTKLALASEVVGRVTEVRQAWVEAVAAEQSLQYAEQVAESASASAEMARRLESVGNYSRLERAREQVFYAETTAQLAAERHAARSAREQLVRLLGLNEDQASALELPETLPELPERPLQPARLADTLNERRLDVQLAKADLEAAARGQGLGRITTFTDIEVGYRSATVFSETEPGEGFEDIDIEAESADGYELEVTVPLFDWGGMQRDALNARTLAAANRYAETLRTVSSSLRENYSAYRTAHDVAMFYQDEILPLRELISEENVLQYNGMLIGVFELLADSRSSIGAVETAIDAQRQFWLAEAALQASITGSPTTAAVAAMGGGDAGGGAQPH